ncbi:MAG TPA: SDR family NAD(P)-dependent oxidoreductase, partial [Promineifilum sp.]|nr:SDR family NAD(P)-dependent oxidoreductase [Promineifilum sp.]
SLAFARRMRQRGHPWGYVAVMLGVYATTRRGTAAQVYPDAATLLGRPPRTLRQYVADYAALFAPALPAQ